MQSVLYADDNDEMIELVKLRLENSEYKLLTAGNGDDAIEVCLEKQPDLVLMDINMPGLDGFAATRQLRDKGFQAPIIVLTGSEEEDDRKQAMAAGCTDYVLKTLDMDNVEDIIDHYIGKAGEIIS